MRKLFENAKSALFSPSEVLKQGLRKFRRIPLERARRTLEKEGSSLDASKPADLVIPAPYFFDRDGNRHDAVWQVSDDRTTLTLEISDARELYPLALDPTLSFTAPGTSNAGSVITGESSNNYFGRSFDTGDWNADGKTDLAVGAPGYSSDTGRAYIFYGDGFIPMSAASADVVITGESSDNYFGTSLASGDWNADGRTDLAVGAYGYSSSTGRASIIITEAKTGEGSNDDVKVRGPVRMRGPVRVR